LEPCHHGVPAIDIVQGHFAQAPGYIDPDAQTLHPDGKLQEQRWHNLHAAIRPLKMICRYANKVVPVELPDTIDTCVWEADERRVHCFRRSSGRARERRPAAPVAATAQAARPQGAAPLAQRAKHPTPPTKAG